MTLDEVCMGCGAAAWQPSFSDAEFPTGRSLQVTVVAVWLEGPVGRVNQRLEGLSQTHGRLQPLFCQYTNWKIILLETMILTLRDDGLLITIKSFTSTPP